MDELSDTPVWKLQRSHYGWMFIRNISDPLSYRACHDRIWIQPCQTCKQDKLLRRRMLPETPLENAMTVMLRTLLITDLIHVRLRGDKINWQHVPTHPFGRKLHQVEIAGQFHGRYLTPE